MSCESTQSVDRKDLPDFEEFQLLLRNKKDLKDRINSIMQRQLDVSSIVSELYGMVLLGDRVVNNLLTDLEVIKAREKACKEEIGRLQERLRRLEQVVGIAGEIKVRPTKRARSW